MWIKKDAFVHTERPLHCIQYTQRSMFQTCLLSCPTRSMALTEIYLMLEGSHLKRMWVPWQQKMQRQTYHDPAFIRNLWNAPHTHTAISLASVPAVHVTCMVGCMYMWYVAVRSQGKERMNNMQGNQGQGNGVMLSFLFDPYRPYMVVHMCLKQSDQEYLGIPAY